MPKMEDKKIFFLIRRTRFRNIGALPDNSERAGILRLGFNFQGIRHFALLIYHFNKQAILIGVSS